ncbi:MAG: transposase [Candidatus Hodarchaeota archaeon]
MRKQRRFPIAFRRQVVEELLSSSSRPAQSCRCYNISSGLLYQWLSRGNQSPSAARSQSQS